MSRTKDRRRRGVSAVERRSTRIRVGGVFDGASFRPEPAILTIDDGQIADVARPGRGPVDVDWEKAFALPGLIDCHAHVTLPADGRDYEQALLDSDATMTALGVEHARNHLAAGVTTIRDNGSRHRTAFEARRLLEKDPSPSPRLLVSGPPITTTRGHFWWCGGEANGPSSIALRVRDIAEMGADHVKVMASGGGTRGTDPGRAAYSEAEMRSAVETAHALGRRATAHCRATSSIRASISAGIDGVEHAEFVNEEGEITFDRDTAEALIASDVWICPTIQASGEHERRWLSGLDARHEKATAIAAEITARIRTIRELVRMGARGRIVFGTDAGPFFTPFGDVITELTFLHRSGLETIDCLRAATHRAACAIGVESTAGRIAEGMDADLLIVAEPPIQDLSTLGSPIAVLRRGTMVASAIGVEKG
jgi:imidazolonepropionase-like amidohydrolase